MLTQQVPFYLAFWAGVVSFLSPCILPMLPAYIMYIAGAENERELENAKFKSLYRTLLFVIGFTIVFMIMGSAIGSLGKLFIRHKTLIGKISGIVIVLFGLNMTGILKINAFSKEKKVKTFRNTNSNFSTVVMGIAFAAGWTPCFGPVLASILVFAGSQANATKGMLLLLVYSIGMAVPFIITALFIDKITRLISKTGKASKYIPIVSGIVLIIFGLLVFFDKIVVLSRFLV